ncbi:pseudouridine synthase [Youxingia wuxianensis]|uniref:Pseudouridine synthase n=1 Tax=Youxingia wuxianensis TaxID=2763678 RepID=A0A926ETU2_9FIRM|nr:16S rRNA pseudouridine(516) synthase [Youxingia wuxianensis]MBC8586369.1 16S rRNA pseudouridine(516) synthase [Youxingia wuxianensis]
MAFSKGRDRIDKVVAAQTSLSRKDVHKLLSKGKVTLNGEVVRNFDSRVDMEKDRLEIEGKVLHLRRYSYLMLNKPQGVVCATQDAALPTVIDLVPQQLRRKGLFPAGRLDKDTEGFVLITNDGELAHRILSPKSHVPKTYTALLDKPAGEEIAAAFHKGVVLDGVKCLPAQLEVLEDDGKKVRVVIRQGMYHQIKRMFLAFGITVEYLRREKIGGLSLDEDLQLGKCRELSQNEVELLRLK